MRLSLGYSPCPNDTFIFYALVHGLVPSTGIEIGERLEDVETLNRLAFSGGLDITKASYHAIGRLRQRYVLLRAGGALGRGCGPLVVAKKNYAMADLRGKTIAIPGELTTAFLLLRIYDPVLDRNVRVMPFDRIIGAVQRGEADAGLIIHESRFTYEAAGLKKVLDLGEWWEEETGLLLPLGGIVARRELGEDTIRTVGTMIRSSLEYALSHEDEPLSYIREHSQELEEDVIRKHIGLYVNHYSLDIEDDGLRAVEQLFARAEAAGILAPSPYPLLN